MHPINRLCVASVGFIKQQQFGVPRKGEMLRLETVNAVSEMFEELHSIFGADYGKDIVYAMQHSQKIVNHCLRIIPYH